MHSNGRELHRNDSNAHHSFHLEDDSAMALQSSQPNCNTACTDIVQAVAHRNGYVRVRILSCSCICPILFPKQLADRLLPDRQWRSSGAAAATWSSGRPTFFPFFFFLRVHALRPRPGCPRPHSALSACTALPLHRQSDSTSRPH